MIDAVIVDYESGDRLLACLASLRSEGCGEVVVVDNSTRSASRAVIAVDRSAAAGGPSTAQGVASAVRVRVLESAANGGFGAGANLGMASTGSALVLVCNPDIELRPGALAALWRRLEDDAGLGLVAPALFDAEGRRRPGARPLPAGSDWLHALGGLVAPAGARRAHRDRQRERLDRGEPAWVPGTCLLVRRAAFEQVGGFDERFFLYLEEVDLCRRLTAAGWGVAEEPAAEVVHVGGVSTSRRGVRSVLSYHRSLWRYADTSATGRQRALLPLVAAGVAARCVVAVGLAAARSPRRVLAAEPLRPARSVRARRS